MRECLPERMQTQWSF